MFGGKTASFGDLSLAWQSNFDWTHDWKPPKGFLTRDFTAIPYTFKKYKDVVLGGSIRTSVCTHDVLIV